LLADKHWAPATEHTLGASCASSGAGRARAADVRGHHRRAGEQLAAVLEEAAWTRGRSKDGSGRVRSPQGHPLRLPIVLAVFAGMDPSDFRSLDWSEVDLRTRLIRRTRNKTGVKVQIPLDGLLLELLQACPHRKGKVCRRLPKDTRALNRGLRRLMERAGIPDAPKGQNGFRRLRHTQATLMAAAGVDVSTIGKSLGHAKGSKMALRYVERDRARHAAAIQAVQAAMDG